MATAHELKQEIDTLSSRELSEVNRFIKLMKKKAVPKASGNILHDLAVYQIEDNLPADLAEQHDHYLYGTHKK